MKQFTIQQIDDALREVINKQPDFVYSDERAECCYHQGPETDPNRCNGCLFGQAFQLLGVTKEELKDTNQFIMDVDFPFLPSLVQRPGYWTAMQLRQDRGYAWKELLQFLPPIV